MIRTTTSTTALLNHPNTKQQELPTLPIATTTTATMRHSSSPFTPLSSASRSPYASFFDFEKVFQCGCTSDVESEHEKRQALHDEESYDEDELHMESARDYVERISKSIATMEESERRGAVSKPKNYSQRVSEDSQTSITTVFRMSTTSSSTINNHFPSLKHTDSESTQETAAISDDEMTLESQDDDDEREEFEKPVSILRRKEKLGIITEATGSGVSFCPTTVFPDPNEVPRKRKRVKRIKQKPQSQEQLQIFVPAHDDDLPELRRLERRACQNQYTYLSSEIRSPSSEILMPSESFYVFR